MAALEWIAVDWGTSQLRAWGLDDAGHVITQGQSENGGGLLARDQFEDALMALIHGWLPAAGRVPVIACGMVGSREGWAEASYTPVPCKPAQGALMPVACVDPRLELHIIPGLSQASPADVMRGEETQIAGYLHGNPDFDGVICLPGTHTKWAHISAGEIVSFATAMTGDLFTALAGHTVLRHALADDGSDWDTAAFDDALSETITRPERLATRLFGLRAEGLLGGLAHGAARARASGLLIGAELAATRAYWLGQNLLVIGSAGLARLYLRALAAQGAPASQADADQMTLAGLRAAYQAQTQRKQMT